jgi:hypothetical protein
MLSNITKKLNLLARVLVPLFVAASFFGCSSALESGLLPGGAGIDGLSASFQQAPPPTLAGTDWLIDTELGEEPYFIVVNFNDEDDGVLLGSDISVTTFSYTYETSDGTGTITTLVGTGNFKVDDAIMSIEIPGLQMFPADLIVPTLTTMTGFVGYGETPRFPYNTVDFESGITQTAGYVPGRVRTTFGDGTYPIYDLIYYDGVSAGLIEDMGLFYLAYDSSNVITVVFPDFYRYHMGQPVVYTPSDVILPSLEGSIWGTSTGSDTVRFSEGTAYFTGDHIFSTPYFYDGYQAGEADNAGGSSGLGSFRILDTSPLTLRFYVYQSTRPFDFTLQVPPPSVKLPGAAPAE